MHIQWLVKTADGLPIVKDIAVTKRLQLVLEARAFDIAKMRALKADKRYTLAVLLVQSQLQKAMDDVAEIFIKTLRNLHHVAEERLKQYHSEHADQVDRLIGKFREVLTSWQDAGTVAERMLHVDKKVGDRSLGLHNATSILNILAIITIPSCCILTAASVLCFFNVWMCCH